MPSRIEARLRELNLILPEAARPVANFMPYVQAGSLPAGAAVEVAATFAVREASSRRVDLATVDGFALRIGQRAALVPVAGARVHGVVMSLTPSELDQLYSEPSLQAYTPEAVLAHLSGGGVIAALCYNLPEPPSPGERNEEYAARLRAVAEKVGLPAEYVTSLR